MAKYFLGSVGVAEAFKIDPVSNKKVVAFISKTLTNSSIDISSSQDEIRGGTGAPVQFVFSHDTAVAITLEDIQWKTAYVEAQLGAAFESGDEAYQSEDGLTADANGVVTLLKTPKALPLACDENDSITVWGSLEGKDEWVVATDVDAGTKKATFGAEFAGKRLCVRYLASDESARVAVIKGNIIPQELFLIITAPIYAGDACAASNGKAAGTITYEIPRFRLDGAQNFNMEMSSNQTMSLSGKALAYSNSCDINESRYLRIIEVIDGRKWYDDAEDLVVDPDCLIAGKIPEVYAIYKNHSASLVDNSVLTFTPALNGGRFASAGSHTIKATAKEDLSVTVSVVSE